MHATARRLLAGLTAGLVVLALAPVASAAISPTVSLTQGGTKAGSTVPFGMDLKFAPTGGDSPRNLTLSLPPGLLSDASVDGGKCLHNKQATNACKVGGGTAKAVVSGITPTSLPLSFYLVAPPKHGDLAGLVTKAQLPTGSQQLGGPGDILIRAGTDPRGIGIDIILSNLPNSFSGIPLSLQELKSSFNGLRLPTSCPAMPATVQITANSYNDATNHTAHAPLHVTGCSTMPFNAAFHVVATKDKGDHGVRVATDLTQLAKPPQATGGSVKLTLPSALTANVGASFKVLCTDLSSGSCIPVGSARAISPLYPIPLTGKVFFTGKLSSTGLVSDPGVAIVFPPPFSLTIQGQVDIAANSTTFHGVPDIPQTDLQVTLFGGTNSLFQTFCSPASGMASAKLTSQDGNRSTIASSVFTVKGCAVPKRAHPSLSSAVVSGLAKGLPKLSFGLRAGKGAPGLDSFVVKLPHGLRFAKHHGKLSGVSITGGKARSISLKNGHLVVSLASSSRSVKARIKPSALAESAGLKTMAKHHSTPSLKLVVVVKDAAGTHTTVSRTLKSS